VFIRHNDLGVSNLKVIHAYSTETEVKLIITICIHIHVCIEERHGNKKGTNILQGFIVYWSVY